MTLKTIAGTCATRRLKGSGRVCVRNPGGATTAPCRPDRRAGRADPADHRDRGLLAQHLRPGPPAPPDHELPRRPRPCASGPPAARGDRLVELARALHARLVT